ncbi:MAG: hypothetical protein HOP07_13600 [Bacteriovoracaceae bacterium]|nr:hypothetical protein [Bacteriovoracaceae bacterium]
MKILNFSTLLLIQIFSITACVQTAQESKSSLKFKAGPSSGVSGAPVVVTGDESIKSVNAFKQTLYPVLNSMSCVSCHGDSKKYQPYYIVSDVNAAWKSILLDAKKVNLETPEASRVYLRVKNDLHNCLSGAGDSDCDAEAATILAEIKKWRDAVNISSTGLKTAPIFFKDLVTSAAEAESGTFLVEAEQDDFPEAMVGRFVAEPDGKASGYRYANTPMPIGNPLTTASRTPQIMKGNACEVTTQGMLANSSTGPYRILEDGTHIPSGATTPSGLIIKDGQRPFSVAVRSVVVRPDRRMEYAKMLTGWSSETGTADGVPRIVPMANFAITDGNFDVGDLELSSSGRTIKTAIDVTNFPMGGNIVGGVSFTTLPYFAERSKVFSGNAYINDPTALIPKPNGGDVQLKNLFKLPVNDFSTKEILNFFTRNDAVSPNHFRRDVMYPYVKQRLDAIIASNSRYKNIVSMDANRFYSLSPNMKLNIMACPGNVCTPTTQAVEITAGSAVGTALTYDNALDILKVNSAGTDFIPGSLAELEAGTAFTRLDIYAHTYTAADANTFGTSFDQVFYSHSNGTFSEKARVSYPIAVPQVNLDLKALLSSSSRVLAKGDKIANFQNTLHPVLTASSCVSCHSGNVAGRVAYANGNSIIAFNEIERVGLANFAAPANSFRKALFPAESMMVHNCGDAAQCLKIQNDLIKGVQDWAAANEISMSMSTALPFKELSEAERTPGMLEYKVKVRKSGLYNLWTKAKGPVNSTMNLRIVDPAVGPVNTVTGIKAPANTGASCIAYTFPNEFSDWTWYTPGRNDDLTKLDSLGSLKKNEAGVPLTLADNRRYWPLVAGKTYTIQIFEAAALTKIDLIALDYVANFDDLLDFQPDILARDENNIADYKKKVLNYDISTLVGLEPGSAFFKAEVKTALGGQNYIFRNPRIISPTANIAVKGIKVFINGATSFTDTTWTNVNVTAGDDQIFTYAGLTALVTSSPATDYFQFAFDKLEKTTKMISELDPRGTAPVLVEGRKCRELDLFLNTVKPILRNVRLMNKDADGINDYLNRFPGNGRQQANNPQMYQCMTCHNDTHPYFKMTTFDYPEILCAQALSRVDFSNYRESLLVRGLDGSGVHPKLHFIEDLQYAASGLTVMPYNSNDGAKILDGMFSNQVGTGPAYFSKWIQGFYFKTYTKADLGLLDAWDSNSEAKKTLARAHMGQLKRVNYVTIPDLSAKPYYESFVHDMLRNRILTEGDNLDTGVFIQNRTNMYVTHIPSATDTQANMNGRRIETILKKTDGKLTGGVKAYDTTSTPDQMNDKLEALKAKYREAIINWIRKEHEHVTAGN